eukprot:4909766-Pyramimonas_sp.AAC.1
MCIRDSHLHRVSEGAGLVAAVAARDVHAAHDALLASRLSGLDQVLGRPPHEEEGHHHGGPKDRGVRRGEVGLVLQEAVEPQEHARCHRPLPPARPLAPLEAGE